MKKKSSKLQSDSTDIIKLILRDHKPLKELILILKSSEVSLSKKKHAYAQFERMLSSHSKAEEESLYFHLKAAKSLRAVGLEGDTEHAIAKQLMSEVVESVGNEDIWMAKVKVLAELVEHHVKEEEKEMFKKVRKEISLDKRIDIGRVYSRILSEDRTLNNKSKNYSDQSYMGAEHV